MTAYQWPTRIYCHNHSRMLTQMYILVLIETHLGTEVMSAFVFLSANIYCSSACFNFHWRYSSSEKPMKILTVLP